MKFNLIISCLTIGMLSAGVYDKTFARNHDDKHDRIFDTNNEGQTDNFRLIDNQPQEIAIDIEENMEWLLNLAYTCYESNDYVTAFNLYNVLANHENCIAQCNLAWMYAHALGTERNDIFAASWFIRAIEQGYDDAISMAERCDANVHFNLGLVYTICAAIQENGYEKAFRWYKFAADYGHPAAQCLIGDMYNTGYGVKANSKKAVKWYKRAIENGNNNALSSLIDMAEHDDIDAQYTLGEMYENGQGVEKNYDEAAKWYKRAADQGYANAQYYLAVMYDWRRVESNSDEAYRLYTLAANQGFAPAQYKLGDIYVIKHDYIEAVKWYKLAADQGHVKAQYYLGNIYRRGGYGVDRDYVEAIKWYKLAADQGHDSAQRIYERLQKQVEEQK